MDYTHDIALSVHVQTCLSFRAPIDSPYEGTDHEDAYEESDCRAHDEATYEGSDHEDAYEESNGRSDSGSNGRSDGHAIGCSDSGTNGRSDSGANGRPDGHSNECSDWGTLSFSGTNRCGVGRAGCCSHRPRLCDLRPARDTHHRHRRRHHYHVRVQEQEIVAGATSS